MLLFSPIEIVIKMLSKKNDVLSHRFLTSLHLEVSGRPSASPSGTTLYLLAEHRWEGEKSFYWSNSYEGWRNKRFKSIRIVRSTSRKIKEILQTFITNYLPDAPSNLSASSVKSSQIPFIKILPWPALRKQKKQRNGAKALSQLISHCLDAWTFVVQFYLCPLPVYQIMFGQARDHTRQIVFPSPSCCEGEKNSAGWTSAVLATCPHCQRSGLFYYRHSQEDHMCSEEVNFQCNEAL